MTMTTLDTETDIQQMAAFGSQPDWMKDLDVSAGATGGRKLAKLAWTRLTNTVSELRDLEETLKGDAKLTLEGRADQLSRAVQDAWAPVANMRGYRDRLEGELRTWRAQNRPTVEVGDAALAAIWARLSEDPIAVRVAYDTALASEDWQTATAIEQLPGVFPGHLGREVVAELRRERLQVEAPAHYAGLVEREATLETVERALHTAEQIIGAYERALPRPDAETGTELGSDGLRTLSPSQLEEAKTGDNSAPPPGDSIRTLEEIAGE